MVVRTPHHVRYLIGTVILTICEHPRRIDATIRRRPAVRTGMVPQLAVAGVVARCSSSMPSTSARMSAGRSSIAANAAARAIVCR